MAQAPVASLESGGGGELLQEPAAGLAGRQLEMHLGPGRAPRPARPPSHDSSTAPRRDDALSRGHPVARRRRGPGTTGSGAADSGDSAAGDSRRDRRDASGAPHRPRRRTPVLAGAAPRGGPPPRERTRARGVAEGRAARARRSAPRDRAAAPHHGRVTGGGALALPGTRGTFPVPGHEGTPGGAETPGLSRCYLSRMPRDIDVGGSLA